MTRKKSIYSLSEVEDMKWIQAAGANTSVEYKENGGGTHLPSVPEIHFKLEIKEKKKEKAYFWLQRG